MLSFALPSVCADAVSSTPSTPAASVAARSRTRTRAVLRRCSGARSGRRAPGLTGSPPTVALPPIGTSASPASGHRPAVRSLSARSAEASLRALDAATCSRASLAPVASMALTLLDRCFGTAGAPGGPSAASAMGVSPMGKNTTTATAVTKAARIPGRTHDPTSLKRTKRKNQLINREKPGVRGPGVPVPARRQSPTTASIWSESDMAPAQSLRSVILAGRKWPQAVALKPLPTAKSPDPAIAVYARSRSFCSWPT